MRISWPGRVLQTVSSPAGDSLVIDSSTVWENANVVEFRPESLTGWFLIFVEGAQRAASDSVNSTFQRRLDWRVIEETTGTQITPTLTSGKDNYFSTENNRVRFWWPTSFVDRFDNPGLSLARFVLQVKTSGSDNILGTGVFGSLIVMEVES